MSPLRWLFAGTTAAAMIAALVVGLVGSGEGRAIPGEAANNIADVRPTSGGPAPDSTATLAPIEEPPALSASAPVAVESPNISDPLDPAPAAAAQATPAPAITQAASIPPPTTSSEPVAAVRLRIPTLDVDAAVAPLGFDGAGGFAVPSTAAAVGWYDFSARPGAPGNTVLGGHLNWRGDSGVFERLDELSIGDMIYLDTAEGELAYRVAVSYVVTAQTPFADILGERSGLSTLTLFTCGGTFSSVAGEYDERVVITAVRI